jgi:hypothetical protein
VHLEQLDELADSVAVELADAIAVGEEVSKGGFWQGRILLRHPELTLRRER